MKLILLLFTFFHLLLAKPFSITIEKPFDSALFDITQNLDRSISAVGFSSAYKQNNNESNTYSNPFEYLSSLSQNSAKTMQLITVDKRSSIIVNKSIAASGIAEAVSVAKTPDDGYYIGGHNDAGYQVVLKLSKQGSVIFSKQFGTQNKNKLQKIIALRDGGVLSIGTSLTSKDSRDSLFNNGLGLNDVHVVRFNKNGHELWSKKFGTEHDDKGIDGVESDDGSLIIVSHTLHDNSKNINLMRVTPNGNKIWLHTITDTNKISPFRLIKLRDNNFLVSLSKVNELNKEQIRLIKFNIQKEILLDKEIYTSYSSGLKDIKEFSNGNIIGVGYVRDEYNTDALVMILDANLNMTRQEHFGGENFDEFNALKVLHNSEIGIVGIQTNKNSQESNMWILKLNPDLKIVEVSTDVEDYYKALKNIFKDEIYAKQITLQKDLNIELSGNKLLFETGSHTLSNNQKTFIKSMSKKLIPFLEKIKHKIVSIEVNGHTSSEWAKENFSSSYLKNEKLSMQRSYSVLHELFTSQDEKTQQWLENVLKGSGLAASKKIVYDNVEYKNKSRRVSIKIILKN